jgi:membrane protease YdiL (CAAX protease family)
MPSISRFAERQPLLFAITTLLAWIVLTGLSAGGAAALLGRPIADPLIQSIGTLIATGVLLGMAHRLGWLRAMGFARIGTWQAWALTLLLTVYVALSGFFAYFGEFNFRLSQLVATPESRAILLNQLRVGPVEEILFRGVILYALARTWGRSRRGLLAALVLQAALFGLLHSLQVFGGSSPAGALANVLATFIFGLWTGALVLLVGSLWPGVILHILANAFTMIKGLSSPWIDPLYVGYLRGALVDLPLALFGLWLVLRSQSAEALKSQETAPPWSRD